MSNSSSSSSASNDSVSSNYETDKIAVPKPLHRMTQLSILLKNAKQIGGKTKSTLKWSALLKKVKTDKVKKEIKKVEKVIQKAELLKRKLRSKGRRETKEKGIKKAIENAFKDIQDAGYKADIRKLKEEYGATFIKPFADSDAHYTIYNRNNFINHEYILPIGGLGDIVDIVNRVKTAPKPTGFGLRFFIIYAENPRRKITIEIEAGLTIQRLEEYLKEDIKITNVNGSDVMMDAQGNLLSTLLNRIDFVYQNTNYLTKTQVGLGEIKNSFYKVNNTKSKKGFCFDACLVELGYEPSGIKDISYEQIKVYLKMKDIKLKVIENYFNVPVVDMDAPDTHKKILVLPKSKRNVYVKKYTGKIKHVYIYNPEDSTDAILSNGEHVDNIIGEREIWFNSSMFFYENDDGTLSQITGQSNKAKDNINKTISKELKPTNIYFDIEAVVDITQKGSPFKAYSISFLEADEALESALLDWENDKSISKETIRNNLIKRGVLKFIYNENCIKMFLQQMKEMAGEKLLTLISFNGSNFDNYFLVTSLINDFSDEYFDPSSVFYNGQAILNFKMFGNATTWDLSRHLVGSLASCCRNFKIKCSKVADFSHSKAQRLYNEKKLFTDEEFKKDTHFYNDFDNISLCVLKIKYERVIDDLVWFKTDDGQDFKLVNSTKPDLLNHLTVGALIWFIISTYWKHKNYEIPEFSDEQIKYYEDIKKFSSAGRCDLTHNIPTVIRCDEGKGCFSLDIKSQYPYQMAVNRNYYPSGTIEDNTTYDKTSDKIGFFYCDIDQSDINIKIQCEKVFNKNGVLEKNEWNTKNILTDYFINTEKIKALEKYGCKLTVKNGFYFSSKIKGCELFRPILTLMKIKAQQDTFKSSKVESIKKQYNESLRETVKLISNALSGKVIEGLHLDVVKFVTHHEYTCEYMAEEKKHNVIDISDKYILVSSKKDIKDKGVFKRQRPIFYGDMIYTFGQLYLYEELIKTSEDKVYYLDTDSGKLTYEDGIKTIEKLKNKKVPHWEEVYEFDERYKTANSMYDSGIYGAFEDELEKMTHQKVSYHNKKKEYAIIEENMKDSKVKIKGLTIRYDEFGKMVSNDIYITDEHKKVLYDDEGDIKLNESELMGFYEKHSKTLNKWDEIFENMIVNKVPCSFVSTQFVKSLKNMKSAGIFDETKHNKKHNTISFRTLIKTVQPNPVEYREL